MATAAPLSHHDILALIEPITRAGYHVDLNATDRLERRILFKPIEHPALAADQPAVSEALEFHVPSHMTSQATQVHGLRLIRRVSLSSGLTSTVQTETGRFALWEITKNAQPLDVPRETAHLLARLKAIGLRDGFCFRREFTIAHDHRLDSSGNLFLRSAMAEVGTVTLSLDMLTRTMKQAELELLPRPCQTLAIPDDLFAVLGRPWGLLHAADHAWRSRMSLKGDDLARSRMAEQRFAKTVAHLGAILATPPNAFHETFFWQRWSVVLRRAVPLLASIAMVIGALALTQFELDPRSAMRVLLFEAAPVILALAFMASEVPRLEVPPLPKRLTAETWFSEPLS